MFNQSILFLHFVHYLPGFQGRTADVILFTAVHTKMGPHQHLPAPAVDASRTASALTGGSKAVVVIGNHTAWSAAAAASSTAAPGTEGRHSVISSGRGTSSVSFFSNLLSAVARACGEAGSVFRVEDGALLDIQVPRAHATAAAPSSPQLAAARHGVLRSGSVGQPSDIVDTSFGALSAGSDGSGSIGASASPSLSRRAAPKTLSEALAKAAAATSGSSSSSAYDAGTTSAASAGARYSVPWGFAVAAYNALAQAGSNSSSDGGWMKGIELGDSLHGSAPGAPDDVMSLLPPGTTMRQALTSLPFTDVAIHNSDVVYRLRPGVAPPHEGDYPETATGPITGVRPSSSGSSGSGNGAASFGGTGDWKEGLLAILREVGPYACDGGLRGWISGTNIGMECKQRGVVLPQSVAASVARINSESGGQVHIEQRLISKTGPAQFAYKLTSAGLAAATRSGATSAQTAATISSSSGSYGAAVGTTLDPRLVDIILRTVMQQGAASEGGWVPKAAINNALVTSGLIHLMGYGVKLGDALSTIPALEPSADGRYFRLRQGGPASVTSGAGGARRPSSSAFTSSSAAAAARVSSADAAPSPQLQTVVLDILADLEPVSRITGGWVKAAVLGTELHRRGAGHLIGNRKGDMQAAVAQIPGVEYYSDECNHVLYRRNGGGISGGGSGGSARAASVARLPHGSASSSAGRPNRAQFIVQCALDLLTSQAGMYITGTQMGMHVRKELRRHGYPVDPPRGMGLLALLSNVEEILCERQGPSVRYRLRYTSNGSSGAVNVLSQEAADGGAGVTTGYRSGPLPDEDPATIAEVKRILHERALHGLWTGVAKVCFSLRAGGWPLSHAETRRLMVGLGHQLAFTRSASGNWIYRLASDVELPGHVRAHHSAAAGSSSYGVGPRPRPPGTAASAAAGGAGRAAATGSASSAAAAAAGAGGWAEDEPVLDSAIPHFCTEAPPEEDYEQEEGEEGAYHYLGHQGSGEHHRVPVVGYGHSTGQRGVYDEC